MSSTALQRYSVVETSERRRSVFYYGSFVLLFFIAVSTIYPPVRALDYFNHMWALSLIGWYTLTTMDTPSFLYNGKAHRGVIYLFIFYTIIVAILSGNSMIANRFLELSLMPFFYIVYQHNKATGRQRDSIVLLFLLLPFVLVTCFITMKACIANPMIARDVKKTVEGFDYMRQGIGGYELIYFLVIAYSILIWLLSASHIRLKRSIGFLVFLTCIVFVGTIVLSNFMTALLMIVFGTSCRILLSKMSLIRVIALIFIFGFMALFGENIAVFALDFGLQLYGDSGAMNAERLLELRSLLVDNQTGGSMDARSDSFYDSIFVFLDHPIFGLMTKPLATVRDGAITGFGQHSLIFDTFALFGLVVGVTQIYIFSQPFFKRLIVFGSGISGMTITIFLIFFILVTINNATPSIGLATFFIYPVLFDWIETQKKLT